LHIEEEVRGDLHRNEVEISKGGEFNMQAGSAFLFYMQAGSAGAITIMS
jgi:hypothetical protein